MQIPREKFHTFDALRFFSFSMVFMSHLPFMLFPEFSFLKLRGDVGVNFFFTLSGFLITYIILNEKQASGSFNFKRYMARRMLRIWPLYYLMVLFAFLTPYILNAAGFTASNEGYEPNWLYSCLFLENYMVISHHMYANVSPLPVTWTLCIEEHFYIIWGIILYFSKVKNVVYWCLAFILVSVVSRYYFVVQGWPFRDILTNFDYFMYGAIPAWLFVLYKKEAVGKIIAISPFYKSFAIVLMIAYILLSQYFAFGGKAHIEPLVFGILFMALLFILLPQYNHFKIADTNLFSRLGIYTYGVYLFHVIVINFMLQLYQKLGLALAQPLAFILFFVASAGLTIVIAIASYHLYEKPFINIKPKY